MNYQFFNRPALVFSLAGLTVLTCLDVPITISLFCLVIWTWKWLAHSEFLAPLSRRWTTILSLLLFVYIFIEYRTLFIQEASSGLLVGLAALKVMDYQNRRDHLLLVLLGFLLLTLKPLYGLDLYLLPVQLICMLSLWWALSQDPRRLPRQVVGQIFLASFPIALILFLVFPRIVAPWAMSQNRNLGRMGFSIDMNPGQIAELAATNGLVLRAQFPEKFKVNPRELYWKGGILSTSKGLAWRDARLVPLAEKTEHQAQTPVDYEMVIEPGNGNVVFALDQTYQLKAADGFVIAYANSIWRSTGPNNAARRYQGSLSPDFKNELSPDQRDLRIQPLPPKSAEWARTTLAQAKDFRTKLQSLNRLFLHPDFVYTLTPGTYKENDLDVFVFERRRGFCEHFAGAYATLARAVGIPARVVSGYQGGEYNPLGGFWRVTQKQAHAWVEIWNGKQWIRQDPTTWVQKSEFSRYPEKSFFAWLDEGYDTYEALNYRWTTFLLDFDKNTQSLTIKEWLPKIFLGIILSLITFFFVRLVKGWLRISRSGIEKLRQDQLSQLVLQIKETEEEYLNQDLSHMPPIEILRSAQKHMHGQEQFLQNVALLYDQTFYQESVTDEHLKAELQRLQKKWLDIQVLK